MTPASPPLPAPLNALEYSGAWFATCARSVARLTLRPMRRTRGAVAKEYDQGRWSKVRENAAWSSENDLRRYLVNDLSKTSSGELVAKMDGAARRVSVKNYYEYRIDAFAQLLERFFARDSEVVELGCGYGYNLFSLAATWPQARFLGFDISQNAVDATQRTAEHFGLKDRVQADILDATDGKHPNFEKMRGKNLFTFFCIEQIPYDVSKVVDNILAHRPHRVVHAEPGTALLKWWKPGDWPDFLYLRSVDYQNELYSVLIDYERQGRLKILDASRMPFSPTLQNTGLMIAWEPT